MQLFAKILPLLFWDLQIVFAALFKSITCNFTSKLNDCTQRKSGKEPPTGCRSSRPEMFCKKAVLRNFAKFTGKHLCQSFFFDKVVGLSPATLSKKRPWYRCFPVNFAKFLSTTFSHHRTPSVAASVDVWKFDSLLILPEAAVRRFSSK